MQQEASPLLDVQSGRKTVEHARLAVCCMQTALHPAAPQLSCPTCRVQATCALHPVHARHGKLSVPSSTPNPLQKTIQAAPAWHLSRA